MASTVGSELEREGFDEAEACLGKISKSVGAQASTGPAVSPSRGMAPPGAEHGSEGEVCCSEVRICPSYSASVFPFCSSWCLCYGRKSQKLGSSC